METLTQVCPADFDSFEGSESTHSRHSHLIPLTPEIRAAAILKRKVKISEWEKLDLRREWVDEKFMRSILSAAGVRSPHGSEPATVIRLRSFMRKAGLDAAGILEAVGVTLDGFLKINPRLPLWAAVAIVLESTGKYDRQARKLTEEQDAQ